MPDNQLSIGANYGDIHIGKGSNPSPSVLGIVINGIVKLNVETIEVEDENLVPYEVQDKIRHNDLVNYKHLIEDYGVYQNSLDRVYKAIEEYLPTVRYKIKRLINTKYKMIKNQLIAAHAQSAGSEIEILRRNSDGIISSIIKYLTEELHKSSTLEEGTYREDINTAIEIIVADAFVNCHILENPITK